MDTGRSGTRSGIRSGEIYGAIYGRIYGPICDTIHHHGRRPSAASTTGSGTRSGKRMDTLSTLTCSTLKIPLLTKVCCACPFRIRDAVICCKDIDCPRKYLEVQGIGLTVVMDPKYLDIGCRLSVGNE